MTPAVLDQVERALKLIAGGSALIEDPRRSNVCIHRKSMDERCALCCASVAREALSALRAARKEG